jgi:hypothetical protein
MASPEQVAATVTRDSFDEVPHASRTIVAAGMKVNNPMILVRGIADVHSRA